jgi:hypothetical protein
MNWSRLGSANPVSKGPGDVPRVVPTHAEASFAADTTRMFAWAPPTTNMLPDPRDGRVHDLRDDEEAWP